MSTGNMMCSSPQPFKKEDDGSALSVVLFGASGDLASRKIFPTLFTLYCKGALPKNTRVIGYARSALSRDEFEYRITKHIICKDRGKLLEFLGLCHYVQGLYDQQGDLEGLHALLTQLEGLAEGKQANRIFYFSVSPAVFQPLAQQLHVSCMSPTGWTRIVVEKPFGKDLESCDELMAALSVYQDDQVFKIDHYLGKAMVQNLLVIRFANSIFGSLWNHDHISNIVISFKEDIGLEGRGQYFDEYGIIRDVMQNHLIQIMALIGMESPDALEAKHIQAKKAEFLKQIKPVATSDLVVGQFGPSNTGWFEKGYLETPHVKQDSKTPTYATAVLFVDNDRWQDVPFILRAGKGLDEPKVEIRIQFKSMNSIIFREVQEMPNELVIRVQPDESIAMKLVTKHPGLEEEIVESEIDLSYKNKFGHVIIPDAYERLLLDVIEGEHSLFIQTEELKEAWRIFTPILHRLESEAVQPEIYPFGSSGPEKAHDLVAKYGFKRVGRASR